MSRRILVVPDLHFPACRKSFLPDFQKLLKNLNPDTVVLIGDVIDSHAVSHHVPEADAQSANDEFTKAIGCVKKLVRAIGKRNTYLCVGNHDCRYFKLASDVSIPTMCLKPLAEFLGIPKSWHLADEHVIDGILFTHGKSSAYGKTAHAYGIPTVEGHFHSKFGLEYFTSPNKTLWSAYVGSALDDSSLCANYAANNLNKSIYGFILVDNKIPRLIKM